MACSGCGDEGHNIRTCPYDFGADDDCGPDCLYELGGIYCPECHRGD